MGPLDRPKRASRFVLELSWASFARFLLPKMALGAFWGCLWLVLGAPEGLLKVVLASVKPISTIKTALPSFDTLFYLAVVGVLLLLLLLVLVLVLVLLLVLVVVLAAVVVVVVLVSLLPSRRLRHSIGKGGVPPLLLPFPLISSLCSGLGPPDRRHRPLGLYNLKSKVSSLKFQVSR